MALLVVGAASASSAVATPGLESWGEALGNGSAQDSSTAVPVSGLVDPSAVAAGEGFELALLAGGTVQSWGSNHGGALGDGGGLSANREAIPGAVDSISDATAIAAGGESALAVLADGSVDAWGVQPSPTEEGETVAHSTPVPVAGIVDATAVSVGSDDPELKKSVDNGQFNLALLSSREVLAWGNDEHGQLGDGSEEYSGSPVAVSGLTEVTAISAGGGQALALLADGHVMAWGENASGQLGDGKSGKAFDSDVPVEVHGLSNVVAISAGGEDSLALLSDGTVVAWGSNDRGELGKSTLEARESDVPVAVPGLEGVSAISAGATDSGSDTDHDLALLGDGHVLAWGDDKHGQLGYPAEEGKFNLEALEVVGLQGATMIAAGEGDSLAGGPAVPVVSGLEPVKGLIGGGTRVKISGFNLEDASSVQFGGAEATSIEEDGETSLIAISPASKPRRVEVSVTTPAGTSGTGTSADQFRYVPEGNLEFGRCLRVEKHTGAFSKSSCTVRESGGDYEWTPEVLKKDLTIARASSFALEGRSETVVKCADTTGSGEYAGPQSIANVTIQYTGCARGKGKKAIKCTSPGAAEGELRTPQLEGAIGFSEEERDQVALELLPTVEGEPFLSFDCGSTPVTVTGGVFGVIGSKNHMEADFKVNYQGSNGRQHIEMFEGGTSESLAASVEEGAPEKVNIKSKMQLVNEEKVEINTTL